MLRIAIKLLICVTFVASGAIAQLPAPTRPPQELSDEEHIPVLIKHLPAWQEVKSSTVFTTNRSDLEVALGERPILSLIDFTTGTETVTARYEVGILLIVEYTNPQASADADAKFTQAIASISDSTLYRRIGNYNVIVFDANNKSAANALIDQVKYEKQVQWLGDNPFRISPERAFVLTTSDMFISTVLIVLIGIGFSVVGGIIAGYVFFYIRDHKRAGMPTFTDAGGMTRLNLDGFTPDIVPKGLLND